MVVKQKSTEKDSTKNISLCIRYSRGVLCQPHHQLSVCHHHHHHCCSCSHPCFSLLIIVQYHPDTLCVSIRSVVDTVNTILIIFMILMQGLGPACGGKSLRRGVTPEEQRIILDVHNKFRAKIARGEERRGRPGPQPGATNMKEMVSVDNHLGQYHDHVSGVG